MKRWRDSTLNAIFAAFAIVIAGSLTAAGIPSLVEYLNWETQEWIFWMIILLVGLIIIQCGLFCLYRKSI